MNTNTDQNLEVISQEESREVSTVPITPASMLSIAVEQGADLDKLEKLMELQEKWERNEAKKAYHNAVAEFKKNPPVVIKDKVNLQYNSRYASKDSLVNTTNVSLSDYGLNARWDIHQGEGNLISVTCILSHALGHSESVTMSAPPDDSGKKNPIQQIKSTKTYLEIATYEAVTGIAVSDIGDDDGNGANQSYITEEQVANLDALIEEVDANKQQFLKVLKIDELSHLPSSKYDGAVKRLEQKRK